MRFLNTLRNKLTRRRKKSRTSRRRRKPRMSRLRRFLNRNRNRLRTRKNVAKGKNQQPKKFKSNCKPSGTVIKPTPLRKCSNVPKSSAKKVSVDAIADGLRDITVSQRQAPCGVAQLKRSLTSSNLLNIDKLRKIIKEMEKTGGKRRKSKRKNKRKY